MPESAVHPFFTRPSHDVQHSTVSVEGNAIHADIDHTQGVMDLDNTAETKKSRARKPRKKAQEAGKGQKTLAEILNPSAVAGVQQPGNDTAGKESDSIRDDVTESGRRKRRRTSLGNSLNVGDEADSLHDAPEATAQERRPRVTQRHSSPQVIIPLSSPRFTERLVPNSRPAVVQKTPPKKMLKLGASGKLSSPVRMRQEEESATVEPEVKKRGRPRRCKEPEVPKSCIVCIPYARNGDDGSRASFAQRVARILEGEERTPQPEVTPKKRRTPRKPAKPTHPFFTGKPETKPLPKVESPRKSSAITPGKLKMQRIQDRDAPPQNDLPFTFESTLNKDRLMVKHPGAKESPWPDREQRHVRSLEAHLQARQDDVTPGRQRKQKVARQAAEPRDSVLQNFAMSLVPDADSALRPDGFNEPRRDMRLPTRLLLSGLQVASRVVSEVVAELPDLEEDELAIQRASQFTVHPALHNLHQSLPKYLSAFDECRGDVHSWAQKYAPSSASEVLQSTREMSILKDWLKSLTVNSVDVAAPEKVATKPSSKPKKKRRRKDDDMDDFLVNNDEEVHEVLTDPEEVPLAYTGKRHLKSTVQVSNGHGKLSNAVLLAGPHGCGKTAAAYAVAKELGFKVFEISSSERRSGRDVLDKVGDMTENHIVQQHAIDPGELSASEDRSIMEAAFQKDLESGRQGKMRAFFKPNAAKAKLAPAKAAKIKTKALEAVQQALKKPPRDQQQSLILLEEVDILFREDKEFWTTVLKMITTSKRPFIMTCNDEDMVPLQAMSLHAILRLTPPPVDLAVDYMLLVAAKEGHLLKRNAVASLYESKNHDLRATITELGLWCQMGVGDPKGGLSWIYQRYPPGSDVDVHGRKLRVISENTYQEGMGLVHPRYGAGEEEVLFAWREFGTTPTSLLGWNPDSSGFEADLSVSCSGHPFQSLDQMSRLADAFSAADVYTTHETTDTTLPPLSNKARQQYTEGSAVLEANELITYSDMTPRLAIATTFTAYRAYGRSDLVDQALTPSHLFTSIQDTKLTSPSLTRNNFSHFDALAAPSSTTNPSLDISVFDGPLNPIALDIAPYVRSIVQYDLALEEQRAILEGGVIAKRARTTRAARSALEGSQRGSTRRERWFCRDLVLDGVLATGGARWPRTALMRDDRSREGTEEVPGSSMEDVR